MKGWVLIPSQATQDNDPQWSISTKAIYLTTLEAWECVKCGYRIPYTHKELPECPKCLLERGLPKITLTKPNYY